MKKRPFHPRTLAGSTLVLSLVCITGLALAAVYTLQRISPCFEMAAQAATWQEARVTAESGIDVGLAELRKNELGFNEGKWNGWSQYNQTQAAPTLDAALAATGASQSLLAALNSQITAARAVYQQAMADAATTKAAADAAKASADAAQKAVGSAPPALKPQLQTVADAAKAIADAAQKTADAGRKAADAAKHALDQATDALKKATEQAAQAAKKAADQAKKKGGKVVPVQPPTLNYANSIQAILGNPVQVSAPIFFDSLPSAAAGNRPTSLDVQLWAVYPTPNPYARWYRLRSMASVALPPLATRSHDRLDGAFRRFNLHDVRPQIAADDMGKTSSVPTPSSTRTIEVLVEPVLPFELAILTDQSLSLATSGQWLVDSYDSSDPNKSVLNGQYPGRNSVLAQSNGSIGTNATRPADAPYGPVIAANGTEVRGAVGTNGADDPGTPAHESVTGASKIDPARIRDDFYRELRPLSRPTGGIFRLPPPPGTPFVAGNPDQPTYYLVTKELNDFSVAPPSPGAPGAVVIMINGDLVVPSGTISIPQNVQAQLFVAGNVDFYNSSINVGGLPAQLQIYGEDSKGAPRTLRAFGNASITGAFYGPQYDVHLIGGVEWFGAVAAKSFEMVGGGAGGFHYDEALAVVGAPIGFRIARYVEDVRE